MDLQTMHTWNEMKSENWSLVIAEWQMVLTKRAVHNFTQADNRYFKFYLYSSNIMLAIRISNYSAILCAVSKVQ